MGEIRSLNSPLILKSDGTGNDIELKVNGTTKMTLSDTGVDAVGPTTMSEQAAADTSVAGKGQVWVKSETPNECWFTNDAGTDERLGTHVVFTTVTSGTSHTVSEDGQNHFVVVDNSSYSDSNGDPFVVNLPTANTVPAGRQVTVWAKDVNAYYLDVVAGSSSDKIYCRSDAYNSNSATNKAQTYSGYPWATFTCDGSANWYANDGSIDGSSMWYAPS